MRDRSPQPGRQTVPAEKARQGTIILRTPLRRAIFIAGLTAAVLFALALVIVAFLARRSA